SVTLRIVPHLIPNLTSNKKPNLVLNRNPNLPPNPHPYRVLYLVPNRALNPVPHLFIRLRIHLILGATHGHPTSLPVGKRGHGPATRAPARRNRLLVADQFDFVLLLALTTNLVRTGRNQEPSVLRVRQERGGALRHR